MRTTGNGRVGRRVSQFATAKTTTGERTGPQPPGDIDLTISSAYGRLSGFPTPGASTFNTYRLMMGDPTVALGYAIGSAPIRSSKWNYEGKKAPAGAVDFITDQLEAVRPWFVHNALFARVFGFAPFERVYDSIAGQIILRKMKPLLPEKTKVLVSRAHGEYEGLLADDGKTHLPVEKAFTYTHDYDSYYGYYGRSLFENLRRTIPEYWNIVERQGQFLTKVASIIMLLRYPEGQSKDATGATVDNFEIAEALLTEVCKGKSITMPNDWSEGALEAVRRGIPPNTLQEWTFDIIEANVDHGTSLVLQEQHHESLILRGMLVPERVATEGHHGTKAESEVHAELSLQISDWVLQDLIRQVNWYIVNPLIVMNYGQSAEGTVKIVPDALVDEKQTFIKDLIRLATAPGALGVSPLDFDALFKQAGLPTIQESKDTGIAEVNKVQELINGPREYRETE